MVVGVLAIAEAGDGVALGGVAGEDDGPGAVGYLSGGAEGGADGGDDLLAGGGGVYGVEGPLVVWGVGEAVGLLALVNVNGPGVVLGVFVDLEALGF